MNEKHVQLEKIPIAYIFFENVSISAFCTTIVQTGISEINMEEINTHGSKVREALLISNSEVRWVDSEIRSS